MANWDLLGEIVITNSWQIFPGTSIAAETFKITTVIENQEQWDKWLLRSGAYLKFVYANGEFSRSTYIKVQEGSVIYEFPIPPDLKEDGYVLRIPMAARASRYLPYTPDGNFASWRLRVEALS